MISNDPELKYDQETLKNLFHDLKALSNKVEDMKICTLMSGEADTSDCFIEIHAGAGGTEAQDWAEMLSRMYLRWAEKSGFKYEYLEESKGEEAGIKSCTIKILGDRAFGWLKVENGIHRLVRISPYDANAKRHTSFASVNVYPVVNDDIDIQIEDKDLRIDTYRASGAGGQHINKTDSAVRITHLPTKIVVQCQQDRSQHRNRDIAMKMLKAKLYNFELQKREEEKMKLAKNKSKIGWGNQIRSYVLQPYQLVKDLRTGAEIPNFQTVLDGNIDLFLKEALIQHVR